MKQSILSLLGIVCLSAALTACGGGGSDSAAPAPEPTPTPQPSSPPVKVGDFELVAGTLDVTAPAGAPRCQNGPALGADLGAPYSGAPAPAGYYSVTPGAAGHNGHIYWLQNCDLPPRSSPSLIEFDPSTGQMRVQPIPAESGTVSKLTNKVSSIRSIAAASDGSVLIADPGNLYSSTPGGIWRFKNGALSKLAGFDRPVPVTQTGSSNYGIHYSWPSSEDGKGGAATFSYNLLGNFCTGPNDTFYFSEFGNIYIGPAYGGLISNSPAGGSARRKVSLDGTVETIDRLDTYYPSEFANVICATNQRVFGYLTFAGTAFGDIVSGQAFSQPVGYSPTKPRYGFGDGLAVVSGYDQDLPSFFIPDLKNDKISLSLWIQQSGTSSSCCSSDFQLNTMPYRMPSFYYTNNPIIDNNNFAYILSGNALLRYKLPGKVQLN